MRHFHKVVRKEDLLVILKKLIDFFHLCFGRFRRKIIACMFLLNSVNIVATFCCYIIEPTFAGAIWKQQIKIIQDGIHQ